nr:C1 family peptidase [Streptomyces sp. MJM8645]
MTGVKDIRQCEDPYVSQAFAAADTLEGAWVLQNHNLLTEFKPRIYNPAGQELPSDRCSTPGGAEFDQTAFNHWAPVPTRDETALMAAVATGPVRAMINASRSTLAYYRGGLYADPSCSSTNLDHAVTIVGYGTNSAGDYWLVKNNWGPTWGLGGYVLMARGINQCGIATQADQPVLNPPGGTAHNPWPIQP